MRSHNVGGGAANTVSLLELIEEIELLTGLTLHYENDERRPGDQLIYVTDCGKIRGDTGWKPEIGIAQTLGLLRTFWEENRNFFHRRAVVRPRPFPVATEALGRAG